MTEVDLVVQLKARIAALEAEMIKYALRYGLSDEARRLLSEKDGHTLKDH